MKTSTVLSLLSDSLQNTINVFFSDCIMSSGIVVSGIFFPADELFRMEEVSETSSPDFVQNSGFEINVNCSRGELPRIGFGEESRQRLLRGDFSIRDGNSIVVDSVFPTVKFPAGISDLGSSLSYVDGDTFSLKINNKE